MGLESVVVNLSGGAANADPALSTGGVKSSVAVLSQSCTLTAIPGVTVTDAAGNAVGSGTLAYTAVGNTLTWTPPGDTLGAPVSIGANGIYIVRGGNPTSGYVEVSVVSSSLSGSTNYSRTATIADQLELMLPPVSKDTALAGATEYFLFYLSNGGATTVKTTAVQLQTDTPGVDTLAVAVVSANNTTELQAAASGHTYSAVSVDVALTDLTAGDYRGIWVRRVIPAATTDGVTLNTFKFRITSLT